MVADPENSDLSTLIPIKKGRKLPPAGQNTATLELELAYGLTVYEQDALIRLNDENRSWKEVIAYIKDVILPRTKK